MYLFRPISFIFFYIVFVWNCCFSVVVDCIFILIICMNFLYFVLSFITRAYRNPYSFFAQTYYFLHFYYIEQFGIKMKKKTTCTAWHLSKLTYLTQGSCKKSSFTRYPTNRALTPPPPAPSSLLVIGTFVQSENQTTLPTDNII